MTQKVIEQIGQLYTDNLKQHGIDSKSVGWPNADDHLLRFDKLLSNVNLSDIESFNDLGSGYGAILDYLSSREKILKTYFAYDISQEMLDAMPTDKYPKTEIQKFLEPYLRTVADFSVASGIFNVRFSESDELWHQHILKTLHNLNDHSKKGFSFNLLSTYVDFKNDHLCYGDPLFFFDYCKKNFSRYVNLYHDYPLWEWTIVVTK